MEYESDGYTNCNRRSWYSHLRIDTRTEELENQRTSGDNLNYSFVEIGQNIEKNSGDLWRLAVSQIPVRNYRLTLVGKTRKGVIIIRSQLTEKSTKLDTTFMGEVFHWELCEKLKFDPMNKCYVHKPKVVIEKEMHEILCDSEKQTDHQFLVRRPDLAINRKKKKKKKKEKRIVLLFRWSTE